MRGASSRRIKKFRVVTAERGRKMHRAWEHEILSYSGETTVVGSHPANFLLSKLTSLQRPRVKREWFNFVHELNITLVRIK